MGRIPLGWSFTRYALGAAMCAWIFAGALSIAGDAQQMRSATAGVYSAAQAARGQELYKSQQCAACHGDAMEGTIGPPMVGPEFLAIWGGLPLVDFVDRIHKTMPFNSPGSLTRQQSIDLTAYILQTGKNPAGQAELGDAQLAQVTFPGTRAAAAAPASAASVGGPSLPPPHANLAELMRAIAFPNANIIFNLQIKDPSKEAKKEPAAQPFDYVLWGATVYPGWLAVDQAAAALVETAPLFLTAGRKCQNGRPVPVDRADWKQFVADMVAVGKLAHETSKARNFDAFIDISDKLNETCANCHKVYRDKGGTEGSGTTRCQ